MYKSYLKILLVDAIHCKYVTHACELPLMFTTWQENNMKMFASKYNRYVNYQFQSYVKLSNEKLQTFPLDGYIYILHANQRERRHILNQFQGVEENGS